MRQVELVNVGCDRAGIRKSGVETEMRFGQKIHLIGRAIPPRCFRLRSRAQYFAHVEYCRSM
jgi:hypothetical protein